MKRLALLVGVLVATALAGCGPHPNEITDGAAPPPSNSHPHRH